MSSIVIAGDTSGSVTLQAPAVAGSTTVNLPSTLGNTGTSAFATTDSSGNLGLGVTPASWATYKAFDIGYAGNGLHATGQNDLNISSNVYYNGGYKYAGSARANLLELYNGGYYFKTAGSGTAGNAITFTDAMTLDASGNLQVGSTTGSKKLVTNQTGSTGYFYSGEASGTEIAYWYYNSTEVQFSSKSAGRALTFLTADTERARIDSSGRLLVGTTSSPGSSTRAAFKNDGGGSIVLQMERAGESVSYLGCDSLAPLRVWDSSATTRFIVTSAGSCQNTTGSYGSISDVKLKENIVDATSKLDDLMKLKVRNYNFITEPQSKQLGFIAQELQEVFPSMIEISEDEDANGAKTGEVTLGVKTTVLIPMLVKAIQEQQALINTLTERISVLENK
jgi:hypothetical protein